MIYILWGTKSINKRYVITREDAKKPCSCIYEEIERSSDLMKMIDKKNELEKNPPTPNKD